MLKIVKCSRCDAPTLQLRTRGAKASRCTMCKAVTFVTEVFRSSSSTISSPHRALPPPQVHSSKRAVLCGVSYKNSSYELDGCVHDARLMRAFLISEFKFPESSIILLSEEESDLNRRPTKYNMRTALRWLVLGCEAGDSLVFYFSGHGSQQKNHNFGEEKDGYDETLCPSDFETEGPIVDDEINWTIVRPLPHGVKLHALIDACHSGTALDLPFLCRFDNYNNSMFHPSHFEWTRNNLRKPAESNSVNGDENLFINNNGSRQEPQLTASEPFDVENRLFSL
ncbi:Peptidase C14, caspase catalytic [Corchorus capsularis]|uniref:Peptidase C14, caspase catalytic n=1 Tax=Corchorus capsularis TaxID=210143 RepID=A0A1R3JJ21_COCAP|nr:Peptidase C14, caspase catalytic [Corchorus capsularis]